MAKNMVAGTYAFTASARTTYQSTDLDGSGPPAPTANLFVNGATGNDAWDGTSATYVSGTTGPWATIGRAVWGNADRATAFADIPTYGPLAAGAGDVVSIAAGTYIDSNEIDAEEDPTYNPVNSGTSGNPITFIADGTVVLQSTHTTPDNNVYGQPIIGAYNRNYIVWDGFYLDEASIETREDSGPVAFYHADYCTIKNCTILGAATTGWSDTNHNGIRIEDCLAITVQNNFISGFTTPISTGENASGITLYDARLCVIENNTIFDCNSGVFIKGDHSEAGWPTYEPLHDNTVRYNYIYDIDIGVIFGTVADTTNSTGPFNMTKVYQNLIVDAWLGAFRFTRYNATSPQYVTVQNNTCIRAGLASVNEENAAVQMNPGGVSPALGYDELYLYNNIYHDCEAMLACWSSSFDASVGLTSDYNCISNPSFGPVYIGTSTVSLATWDSTYGTTYAKDANSLTDDPVFTNEVGGVYTLQGSSTLINAGYDLLNLTGGGIGSAVTMGCFITGFEQIGAAA